MPRLVARTLAATLLCGALGACSSTPTAAVATPAPKDPSTRTLAAARDLHYAETFEILFGTEHVGYLVEVLPAPEGLADERPWKPGTLLIQSPDLEFIGFITPGGTTWRFEPDGGSRAVGFGSRDQGIAAFFGRSGAPKLVTTQPGLERG